jgi:sterol desaturase/sphingolipid hydroxylase (fatty acid hydroxylase superfamily)
MIEFAQNSWAMIVPFAAFAIFALAERLFPRQNLLFRNRRWITHAGFFVTNIGIGRAISLISVTSAAVFATQRGWGALNLVDLPLWVQLLVSLVVYDFAVWGQHAAMHKSSLLWRMHQVHHSDRELDVTTALRFHPFELIISTAYKSLVIIALGAPAWIAIAVELWLGINALFNHSNIALPRRLDYFLRYIIVTPDMHLVHHSIDPDEQRHNFGFGLTIWDRIFGRYLAESHAGRSNEIVGLQSEQNTSPTKWGWSMVLPFRPVK